VGDREGTVSQGVEDATGGEVWLTGGTSIALTCLIGGECG